MYITVHLTPARLTLRGTFWAGANAALISLRHFFAFPPLCPTHRFLHILQSPMYLQEQLRKGVGLGVSNLAKAMHSRIRYTCPAGLPSATSPRPSPDRALRMSAPGLVE
jgi:hypothetical protein